MVEYTLFYGGLMDYRGLGRVLETFDMGPKCSKLFCASFFIFAHVSLGCADVLPVGRAPVAPRIRAEEGALFVRPETPDLCIQARTRALTCSVPLAFVGTESSVTVQTTTLCWALRAADQ